MANTPQQNAINLANSLLAVMGSLSNLKQQIDQIVSIYNAEQVNTVWSAMATAALNADGSLGAADASPVTTHPITVGSINKSEAQLISGMTCIEQLQNFFNNVAVTTGNYIQTVRDLNNA